VFSLIRKRAAKSFQQKKRRRMFLKCFCVMSIVIGLVSSQVVNGDWDPNFCQDFNEGQVFPHYESCRKLIMCVSGAIVELECPLNWLFDPFELNCAEPHLVTCLIDCQPGVVEFVPVPRCENYILCTDIGEQILLSCRSGLHWNPNKQVCDSPQNAGCDVSQNSKREE